METDYIGITFQVNGCIIRDRVPQDMTLLRYLRDVLKLTGAKNGCSQGHCGTCTVLVDGRPRKSCALKLSSKKMHGAKVETIEGLSAPGQPLHPVQEAFIRAGAIQCGFCTPGMIMTAKGLLDRNPDPGVEEIKSFIGPRNLCRCTGYQKIVEAVQDAARVLRGEPSRLAGLADDASMRLQEAEAKARGQVLYSDDIVWPETLHGRIVFASEPHARLTKLEIAKAKAMEGVRGVITSKDIPGRNLLGFIERDQPGLVEVGGIVRSMADPICAVFAETPEQAEAAAAAVVAGYEILPGVFSVEEAIRPDAPLVWEGKKGNIFYQSSLKRGDVDKGLADAEVVVRGRFTTSRAVHGYMEPESGLAKPDGKGGVEVYYPTQTVFDDQAQLMELLALPKEKVRVIQLPTGGAFGGKEDIIFHHILAVAALKFQRPAKITLSRGQSLQVAQKKHPALFELALGLDRDGRFKALSADILTDKGAYATLGFDIIENMMAFVGGPYYFPVVRINGKSVYTHNVMSGAMRGFGANQANFAIESLVDMAAEGIGLSPFEIRRKNALRTGLPTVTNHVLEPGLSGAREVVEALEAAVAEQAAPEAPEGMKLGLGIACGVKNVGFGHGVPESAGARVVLTSGGECELFVTHHEYGQGAIIGQARIAANVLGISAAKVKVHGPDTGLTPYTGATTASRQTFLSGNATLGACSKLLSDILARGAEQMGLTEPAELRLDIDAILHEPSGRRLPLSELGSEFSAEYRTFPPKTEGFEEQEEDSGPAPAGDAGFTSRRTHWAYAYGAQAVWVGVDPKKGTVKALKIITVSDVGRVLNKRAVEGQQEGGVMMGVGYALSEEFKVENGKNVTRTLKACGLPRANATPEIINVVVEVPNPWGPFGVKGLAEAPSLATAPAIANAVFNAVGVRITHIPIAPDKVVEGLTRAASCLKGSGDDG